jgi:predicted RNA-binding protein with PIN domain
MPYLIDGHNLIGSMPNIHLDDPDDEVQLIQEIVVFFRKTRKTGTVYFDKRSPGRKRKGQFGRLKAEFATPPNTADHAIMKRLRQLKGEAKNYTIVSSDQQVKQAAWAAGARVLESHEFVQLLHAKETTSAEGEEENPLITPDDVNYWERIFHNSTKNNQ